VYGGYSSGKIICIIELSGFETDTNCTERRETLLFCYLFPLERDLNKLLCEANFLFLVEVEANNLGNMKLLQTWMKSDIHLGLFRIRDSSVDVVTRLICWTTEKSWFHPWQGLEIVLFSKLSRPALEPIQPHASEYRSLSSLM
jgi:hypothetical protein